MTTSGRLTITFVEAKLTRDTELVGKMDPYVVLKYREQVLKTKTNKNGGKNPSWNEELELDVKYVGDDCSMTVMDWELLGKDKIIGSADFVKISSFIINGAGIDDWWAIGHKGKKCGEVRIKCVWKPAGGDMMYQQNLAMMGQPQ